MNHIRIVIAAALLVAAGATTVTVERAAAQSTATCVNQQQSGTKASNAIVSGLWAGLHLDWGGSYTLAGDKVNSSGAGCTTAPVSSRTTIGTSTTATTNRTTTPSTATTAPTPATANAYVALGDSVAAGVGLPNVSQVPANERRCGRTQNAYSYEVARTLNLSLVHIACSGATAGDLVTKQRSGGPNQTAQLDRAFAGGKPQLITITAGANDANWVRFVRTCYAANCATRTQTTLANASLVTLQAKLLAVFESIMARSQGNPPQVIMTGYYNPISPACTTVSTRITPEEIVWMTASVSAINKTIEDVVRLYPFARFAPVDYTGHDVCSNASWVQGLNDPQPFHPTAQGQSAIAQAVLAARNR